MLHTCSLVHIITKCKHVDTSGRDDVSILIQMQAALPQAAASRGICTCLPHQHQPPATSINSSNQFGRSRTWFKVRGSTSAACRGGSERLNQHRPPFQSAPHMSWCAGTSAAAAQLTGRESAAQQSGQGLCGTSSALHHAHSGCRAHQWWRPCTHTRDKTNTLCMHNS